MNYRNLLLHSCWCIAFVDWIQIRVWIHLLVLFSKKSNPFSLSPQPSPLLAQLLTQPARQKSDVAPLSPRSGSPTSRPASPFPSPQTNTTAQPSLPSNRRQPISSHPHPQPPTGGTHLSSLSSRPSPSRTRVRVHVRPRARLPWHGPHA
jgi:hypothetical protein